MKALASQFETKQLAPATEDVYADCICAVGYHDLQPDIATELALALSNDEDVPPPFARQLQEAIEADSEKGDVIGSDTVRVIMDLAADILHRSPPAPSGWTGASPFAQGSRLDRKSLEKLLDQDSPAGLTVNGEFAELINMEKDPQGKIIVVKSEALARRSMPGVARCEPGFPHFAVDLALATVCGADQPREPSPVPQKSTGLPQDQGSHARGATRYCDNYQPSLVSYGSSVRLVPEFCDTKGTVRVPQSEGAASADLSLVSEGFGECSAVLIKNTLTKKTLLIHHDSGTRAQWEEENDDGDRPASPATPKRGLIGRDRFHYEAFMKEPGPKKLLLVDSELGYDRHEVVQQIVARGAEELPPLTLRLDPQGAQAARWRMVYRPKSDELVLHLEQPRGSTVMHFTRLLTDTEPVKPASRGDSKEGARRLNIVDDLQVYRQRCAAAPLDSATRKLVDLCLTIAAQRNINQKATDDAWDELEKLPRFKQEFWKGMEDSALYLQGKDGGLMAGLTRLVDSCLG